MTHLMQVIPPFFSYWALAPGMKVSKGGMYVGMWCPREGKEVRYVVGINFFRPYTLRVLQVLVKVNWGSGLQARSAG